jgi:antitoxin HicB
MAKKKIKRKKATAAARYPFEIHWSDEDQRFIATVYDLPGCLADGETEEEAARAAHDAAQLWVEVAQEEGRDIPRPSRTGDPSGKFLLRLPVFLHRQLQALARREGVPLNQLVIALLAQREAEKRRES